MGDTSVFSVRVPKALKERLERLASAMDRDRSWVVKDALERYVADQAWQVEAIGEGIAAAERGELIDHETVAARWDAKHADRLDRPGRRRSR